MNKKEEVLHGVYFQRLWFPILGCLLESVQFSRSVLSDSLRPPESQHARPPGPSPTYRVHPNPCPSSWWCHPTVSSSVVPFSSCPQSFPASGSFPLLELHRSFLKTLMPEPHTRPIKSVPWGKHVRFKKTPVSWVADPSAKQLRDLSSV